MKRFSLVVAVLAGLTLPSTVWALEKGVAATKPAASTRPTHAMTGATAPRPAANKPGNVLRGEYAIMASELKLSAEVKARLAEKVQAKMQAVEAWDKENTPKLHEIQARQQAAEAAKDEAGAKAARDQLRALADEKQDLMDAKNAEILSVLTPEQQQQWEAFGFYRNMMRRFLKTDLTPEQQQKIREMSKQAAVGYMMDSRPRAMARDAAAQKLAKEVELQVITPAQRAKMAATSQPTAPGIREPKNDAK